MSSLALFLLCLQLEREVKLKDFETCPDCRIVPDLGEAVPFDEKGRARIQVEEKSKQFEIRNEKGEVLFFGIWRHYEEGKTIEVSIGRHLSEQILISARRIEGTEWQAPGRAKVIDLEVEALKARGQTSDYLKEQAGVAVQKTNLGGGSPIMRGLSGNRVLLMFEGFRLNNSTYRLGLNQYLNSAPSGAVAQMETVEGPAGVLYGSDSLGGTIHLRTLDPAKLASESPNYRGSLSLPDGTHRHQLQAGLELGNYSLGGHVGWNQYEDQVAGGDQGEQPFTGYGGYDASLLAARELEGGARLRVLVLYSDARSVPRTDRLASGADLEWEYQPQIFSLSGLRYERPLQGAWAQNMEMGLARISQEEGIQRISARRPNSQSYDFTGLDSDQFNAQFNGANERWDWVYGFEASQEELEAYAEARNLVTGTRVSAPARFPDGSSYKGLGLFAQADLRLGRGGRLALGLRQSWSELRGTLVEPIGAVRQKQSQLTPSLQASLDRDWYFLALGMNAGFRAPSMEDSLVLGPQALGFDAPNPDLEPERLWSYEAIARLRGETWQMEASAYTSRLEDMVERVPGTWLGSSTYEGEPVFINDNHGRGRIDGAAFDLDFRPVDQQRLSLDVAWTLGRNETSGEYATRIPPLRGNLAYGIKNQVWSLETVLSWAQRQDKLSSNDQADPRIPEGGTPGYAVVHLRAGRNLGKLLQLNLALENLFDELYKVHGSGIYESGRRYTLSLTTRLR